MADSANGQTHKAKPPTSQPPASLASPKAREGGSKKIRHRNRSKKKKKKSHQKSKSKRKQKEREADDVWDEESKESKEEGVEGPVAEATAEGLQKLADRFTFLRCESIVKPKLPGQGWSMMDVMTKADSLQCYAVTFSNCNTLVATGGGDAAVRLFSVKTGKQLACFTEFDKKGVLLPATALSFHPQSKHKILLVANADGSLTWWDCDSQKVIHQFIEGERDQDKHREYMDGAASGQLCSTLAVNYRKDGKKFVSGDAQCNVRVYDDETKQVVNHWGFSRRPDVSVTSHSCSVYSAKFSRRDENIVVTGGWDFCVKLWDIRQSEAVMSIRGPYITGDSVAINDRKELLTGSFRQHDQLQVWDMRTGGVMYDVEWDEEGKEKCPLIYSCAWSEDGKKFVAGGKHANQARMFVRNDKRVAEGTNRSMWNCMGYDNMETPIYSVAMSPNSKLAVMGGGDPEVHLFKLNI